MRNKSKGFINVLIYLFIGIAVIGGVTLLYYKSRSSDVVSPRPSSSPNIVLKDTPPPLTDSDQCSKGGGTWKTFSNGGPFCQDQCNKPANVACSKSLEDGCDCGQTSCWNGTSCIPNKGDDSSREDDCTSFGGKWLEGYSECEGITSTQCQAIGGTFDNCASACRNQRPNTFCIQVCIALCKL